MSKGFKVEITCYEDNQKVTMEYRGSVKEKSDFVKYKQINVTIDRIIEDLKLVQKDFWEEYEKNNKGEQK